MLNIYLCEDNDVQRQKISALIKNIILFEDYDLHFEYETHDPHQLLEKISTQTGPGLYFLDIDLNSDMNGLALAQEIRKKDSRGFIVFITTHSEMSYMTFSYKVEALDFIIKDNTKELQNRIHQCIIDAYNRYSSPNNHEQRIFKAVTAEKEYCIAFDEIIYFETSENIHKVILHTKNGILEFPGQLKNIETQLDKRFFRCHRSFLINKDYLKEVDLKNNLATMTNNETCFVSVKAMKTLKNL